jgi:hypothetical protein
MNLQLILYNDITIIHSLASIRQIVVKFLIGVETLQLFIILKVWGFITQTPSLGPQ